MKAIYCPHCSDFLSIQEVDVKRYCACERSWGLRQSNGMIVVSPDTIPIGIPTREFKKALAERPDTGHGQIFPSFILPRQCKSIITTQ